MAAAPSFEKWSHSSAAQDKEKHREFNREVREMVSTLTSRIGLIRKGGSSQSHHHQHHEVVDDEGAASVITVAGTNTGATMRADLNGGKITKLPQEDQSTDENSEALSSYINSNFQAINNSIMFGGSYTGNDPGVHMDISDLYQQPHNPHKANKSGRDAH